MPKFFTRHEQDNRQNATSKDELSIDARAVEVEADLENTGKTFWQRLWPVMACGTGLFSDGCR